MRGRPGVSLSSEENNFVHMISDQLPKERSEGTWHEQLVRDQMNHYFDIYSRLTRYTVTIVMVLLSPYFTNTCCFKCWPCFSVSGFRALGGVLRCDQLVGLFYLGSVSIGILVRLWTR